MRQYDEQAVAALLKFDWTRLEAPLEKRDAGIWIEPPDASVSLMTPAERSIRLAHPYRDFGGAALPFPFTADQCSAFCESAGLFADNYLERRIDSSEMLPVLTCCLT